MEVKQVATILQTVLNNMTGAENVVAEDLSNIVDIGDTIANLVSDNKTLEKFIGQLHDHIGRVVFADDRSYEPVSYGLKRDAWEYGGLLEKVYIDLPTADDNETWTLTAGEKYDDILVYSPPNATAKFFDKMVTYSIPMSYADTRVIRTAFSNAEQVSAFFAAVENRIRTARDFYNAGLELRTLNNIALEKAKANKVINLLSLYNDAGHVGETNPITTAAAAIGNKNFLRFAAATIAKYSDYMGALTEQFNDGGFPRQSVAKYQKFFTLSEFARNIEVYSESDTYHNEFVKLIDGRRVPNWQGVKSASASFDFATCSQIIGKPASGSENALTVNGVVGILIDRDAAAVCCENYRVTSFYNAGNETIKYYHKWDARYMNDMNENAVVFAIQNTNATASTTARTTKRA